MIKKLLNMAVQSGGQEVPVLKDVSHVEFNFESLEKFSEAIREECAKVCDNLVSNMENSDQWTVTRDKAFYDCAEAIRGHKGITSSDDKKSSPWGRDDLMAMATVRYCLGRMTYIVSDCADWLIEHWENIAENTREIIKRDIEEAFEQDDDDREKGREYKRLGHDADRQQWERVRQLWYK
jgi:hypothetical protein